MDDRHDFETESTTRKMQVGKKGKELKDRNCEKAPSPARCALRTCSTAPSSLSLSPAVPSHQQKNARRYGYLFSKKKSSTQYNSEVQLISSRRAYIDTQRDAIF